MSLKEIQRPEIFGQSVVGDQGFQRRPDVALPCAFKTIGAKCYDFSRILDTFASDACRHKSVEEMEIEPRLT